MKHAQTAGTLPKKKIVLACTMDEDGLKNFERLKGMSMFEDYEWHFIHISQVSYYFNDLVPFVFPNEEQKKEIVKIIEENLISIKNRVMPQNAHIVVQCLFATDPKKEMVKYLQDNLADVVAVSTRLKEGLAGIFTSSFAEYMIRHAPCDVMVIRPLAKVK